MYDLAKRSLAFTVATSGLLLTGSAYSPAMAAAGLGSTQGPAQAQEVGGAASAPSAPDSAAASDHATAAKATPRDRAAQPPDLLSSQVLRPQQRAGTFAPGAAATSSTFDSGGILSGNTLQIPIDLGLDLCGNSVQVAAVHDKTGGSLCSSDEGATATSSESHSGGIASGNQIQLPVNVPVLACGNEATLLGLGDLTDGSSCQASAGAGSWSRGAGARPYGDGGSWSRGEGGHLPEGTGGASATAVSDHSGGLLSGNIIQAPINIPVIACGNSVNAGVVKSTERRSTCSTAEGSAPTVPGAPVPGSGGASATALSTGNGGIGSGMTVQTPIDIPVTLCSNTVDGAVFDDSVYGARCAGAGGSATAFSASSHNGGLASGNVLQAPINVPVTACGNEVLAAAGDFRDDPGACTGPARRGELPPGATAVSLGSDNGGIASGNDVQTPIDVPADVCGNGVDAAVVHAVDHTVYCVGPIDRGTAIALGENNGGIGSGNDIGIPVNAPVDVCGNDVQVGAVADTEGGADCGSGMPPGHHRPCPPPPPTCPPPPPPYCPPPWHHHRHLPTPPTSPSPPPWTPPWTPWHPHHHPHHFPHRHHHRPGHLAHTGADVETALGVAGAALLAGFALRVASRRREGEE